MAGNIKKIGVLALQGAYLEHINILSKLNCQVITVKKTKELENLDGLILPGGESTTIGKMMEEYNFIIPIKEKANSGMGIMGTCAGLILLANKVKGGNKSYLQLIDIEVERNAYGRQIESFEEEIMIPELGINSFPAVFIRAPQILSIRDEVVVLARYKDEIVLARQGGILVSAFHPELTDDTRIHQYFLEMLSI